MYKKTTLLNGLRIITVPMPNTKTVTVLVLVATGSKYETKEINGVSHFLEHMMFKGTKKRPSTRDIAEPLDRIGCRVGSDYNAFTGQEYTGYYAKASSRYFDLLADIISDISLHPNFNQKEIEKERSVIIEEINMYNDIPQRRVSEIWQKLLYSDQPAGWDVAGRKEIIKKLNQRDFFNYHNAQYVAPNMLVVIAGDIKTGETLNKVRALFRGIKANAPKGKMPTAEKQLKPKLSIEYKKTDQTHIILGARSYNLFDNRRYALEVLATILGSGMSSRLFQLIREKMGAAYYVHTDADQTTDAGYFATAVGADNKRTTEVLKAILLEYEKLKGQKVSQDELGKAKDHLNGALALSLETSDEMASFYGFQEILKKEILEPEEIIKKIKTVTAEEIMAVAKDIFRPEKLNLAVIGPHKNSSQFAKLLKI